MKRKSKTGPVTLLDWDTRFFGRRIARLEPSGWKTGPALDASLTAARAGRIKFLFGLVECRCVSAIRRLRRRGFTPVIEVVDLWRPLKPLTGSGTPGVVVRLARPADLPALRRISGTSFRFDRFHADRFFGKKIADKYHRTWITNLCRDKNTFVLVASLAGCCAGFVAGRYRGGPVRAGRPKTGKLVLIAVGPGFQGRGIGRALVRELIHRCAVRRLGVEVRTEVKNTAALALYRSNGFKVIARKFYLRKTLKN